jgi:hypothetical protein
MIQDVRSRDCPTHPLIPTLMAYEWGHEREEDIDRVHITMEGTEGLPFVGGEDTCG